MAGKNPPDLSCILQFRLADLEIFQRYSLAVQHAINVVVGLNQKLCRVRKRLIFRKPRRLRVSVRTHKGKSSHMFVECSGDPSCIWLCWEKAVWVDQHDLSLSLFALVEEPSNHACKSRCGQMGPVSAMSSRRRLHSQNHLLEITNSTVLPALPLTVTDFSQVLGSENTGRCTLRSVSTS